MIDKENPAYWKVGLAWREAKRINAIIDDTPKTLAIRWEKIASCNRRRRLELVSALCDREIASFKELTESELFAADILTRYYPDEIRELCREPSGS